MLKTEYSCILNFYFSTNCAMFNLVGALVMMILDKKPDMKILEAMG